MNLSSSDEGDYSSNDEDIVGILQGKENGLNSKGATETEKNNIQEGHDDDSEDFDEVDWEDVSVDDSQNDDDDETACIEGRNDNDASHRSFPTRAVTINFADSKPQSPTTNHIIENGIASDIRTKTKRKRKRTHKIQSVEPQVQQLVEDLHNSHLLACTSRTVFISSFLGSVQEEIWHVGYSLIPLEFIEENTSTGLLKQPQYPDIVIPAMDLLSRFCQWFFDLVNHLEERRRRLENENRAAGAYSYLPHRRRQRKKARTAKKDAKNPSSNTSIEGNFDETYLGEKLKINRLLQLFEYISPTIDEHPDLQQMKKCQITPIEKVLMFICMTRSLNWRVRFVQAIDPISKALTVDHPLLSTSVANVFRSILKNSSSSSAKRASRRKATKRKASNMSQTTGEAEKSLSEQGQESKSFEMGWVEVLCAMNKDTTSSQKSSAIASTRLQGEKERSKWVHVDPHYELIDKPLQVESIRRRGGIKRAKRGANTASKHVAFVIATEHRHHLPEGNIVGQKDVIPTHLILSSTRLVDVTPRYSNAWSKSLQLRGATTSQISKSRGKCPNIWWGKSIKKINSYFSERRADVGYTDIKRTQSRKMTPYKVERCTHGKEILVIASSDDEPSSSIQGQNSVKRTDYDDEALEEKEFEESRENEALPTSKASFKNHPLYLIPSVLKSQEVLALGARSRICGVFKGELVYKRSDCSTAFAEKKWLYQGRRVRKEELKKPAKVVKARKKPVKKGFEALDSYSAKGLDQAESLQKYEEDEYDGKSLLYGIWQTDPWSPTPVGIGDPIPVNEHKNIELALINPGLIHLELSRIALVAKRLGIPYAPCLLGFEGHGGNRTPTIRGIVVHETNRELLLEAHTEWESQTVEIAYKERQQAIHKRWRKLMFGMMTKERLEREYAND